MGTDREVINPWKPSSEELTYVESRGSGGWSGGPAEATSKPNGWQIVVTLGVSLTERHPHVGCRVRRIASNKRSVGPSEASSQASQLSSTRSRQQIDFVRRRPLLCYGAHPETGAQTDAGGGVTSTREWRVNDYDESVAYIRVGSFQTPVDVSGLMRCAHRRNECKSDHQTLTTEGYMEQTFEWK